MVDWFASPLSGGLYGHSSWVFCVGATVDRVGKGVGKGDMNTTVQPIHNRHPRRNASHHGTVEVERPLLSFVVVAIKLVAFGVFMMTGS